MMSTYGNGLRTVRTLRSAISAEGNADPNTTTASILCLHDARALTDARSDFGLRRETLAHLRAPLRVLRIKRLRARSRAVDEDAPGRQKAAERVLLLAVLARRGSNRGWGTQPDALPLQAPADSPGEDAWKLRREPHGE